MDPANNGAPLRSRHDLSQPQGVRSALREVYPPDEAAEESFDQLLGRLSNEPSANGVKSALRESFPPALEPEANLTRLIGDLNDQPGCNAPTRIKRSKGAGRAAN